MSFNIEHRRAAAILISVAIACLVGVGPASSTVVPSRRAVHHSPIATSARTLNLVETGSLHLVSHHREVLTEKGSGSGTLSGSIMVRLTLSYSEAAVSYTAYPPGGTIVGHGEGSIYAQGHTARFNGTASITGGTGKYAHASGNVKLTGTLQRKTYAFTVRVEGKMRY
jgi:hypothetical protein